MIQPNVYIKFELIIAISNVYIPRPARVVVTSSNKIMRFQLTLNNPLPQSGFVVLELFNPYLP